METLDRPTNLSLAGKEAQKMTLLQKLGSALFVLGLFGLIITFWEAKAQKTSIAKLESYYILGSFGVMILGSFLLTYFKGKKFSPFSAAFKYSNWTQKLGLGIGVLGFSIIAIGWSGYLFENSVLFLTLAALGSALGICIYTYGSYAGQTKGIKNNYVWFNSLTNGGLIGWVAGIALTGFYIQLYWFPKSLETLVRLFDPLSELFRGKPADQWFIYGTIYTFLIFFLGIKFIIKYRHNRYQTIRTIVVILSQVVFAYFIPTILESMNEGVAYFNKDLKNVWPLNYYFTESWSLNAMTKPQNAGPSGTFFFVWGLLMFLIFTPLLTYWVGKRWYCSWVCGCGGLAETAGDGFRQLSSKKRSAWKIERWMMHLVMVFVLIMTVGTLWPYFSGKDYEIGFMTITQSGYVYFILVLLVLFTGGLALLYRKFKHSLLLVGAILLALIAIALGITHLMQGEEVFLIKSKDIKKAYGFFIGAAFSGVIGVGFYPILGNRVWCRFGCPMAGYMGIFQRFKSRFRITTNGSQCISCGNCSTYCEQGIDVRAYAQKGENIVRASCVGCGVCSAVCPRGVLKLENGPEEGRFEPNPLEISKDGVKLNM